MKKRRHDSRRDAPKKAVEELVQPSLQLPVDGDPVGEVPRRATIAHIVAVPELVVLDSRRRGTGDDDGVCVTCSVLLEDLDSIDVAPYASEAFSKSARSR